MNVRYNTLTEYKVVNTAPIVAIKYTTILEKEKCPYADSSIISLL